MQVAGGMQGDLLWDGNSTGGVQGHWSELGRSFGPHGRLWLPVVDSLNLIMQLVCQASASNGSWNATSLFRACCVDVIEKGHRRGRRSFVKNSLQWELSLPFLAFFPVRLN